MDQGLPDLRVVNFSGPSRDAATGEVIWRHRALDADGICAPGISVYFVILCGVWKISGFGCSKYDERNPKINPTWILIPIACQIWMPSRVFLEVLFIKFDYFLLHVAFDWFAKTAVSSKPIRYKTVLPGIFFSFFLSLLGERVENKQVLINKSMPVVTASGLQPGMAVLSLLFTFEKENHFYWYNVLSVTVTPGQPPPQPEYRDVPVS